MAGMATAAVSAAVASFAGLRGLAMVAGWPDQLAWLLPVTIDAYAMTSARVWLTDSRAQSFARANAIGAIATSIIGNAGYHLVATGIVAVSWPMVVLVGAVPAAVLGLTAHLHALRTVEEPRTTPEDRPAVRTRPRPRRTKRRTEASLLKAAREADVRYRATHAGRPITRDELRSALRVAGPMATELRRQLAGETTDRKEAQSNR